MPPPSTTQTEPPVTTNAFAAMSFSRETTRGKPAERPARINLFTPKAMSTKTVSSIPVRP